MAELAVGMALFCGLLMAQPAVAGVRVIVHDQAQAAQLDRRSLRAIYTMHMRRWHHGPVVRVFTLPPDTPAFEQFSQRCLGLPAAVLRRLWRRNIFTGIGWVPQTVHDEAQMVAAVADTPGAIGFVTDDAVKLDRVISVEGLCDLQE